MRISSLALIIAVASCVLAAQGSQPPPPPQQTTPKNADASSQNPPVVTPSSQNTTPQPTQPTAPQDQQRRWWDSFADNGANWSIVLLTFVLAVLGSLQWWATHTANKHNAVIERAYLNMSHLPPGLHSDGKNGFQISFKVQNTGNTPADILGGYVSIGTTDKPGYQWIKLTRLATLPPAYLGPNEPLLFHRVPVPIAPEALKTHMVLVTSSIDYRDRFGDVHESGYGRHYIAGNENNLVFDVHTTGLNYDRPYKGDRYDKWGQPKDQPHRESASLSG